MSTTTPAATATRFRLRVSGRLPLRGSQVTIESDPCRLVRDEIKHAHRQLTEGLVAAHGFRLHEATLELVGSEGQTVRSTRLLERPGGEGYLVRELTPGGPSGDPALWLVACAKEFGRKRSL